MENWLKTQHQVLLPQRFCSQTVSVVSFAPDVENYSFALGRLSGILV
jgi:hypothetical protein